MQILPSRHPLLLSALAVVMTLAPVAGVDVAGTAGADSDARTYAYDAPGGVNSVVGLGISSRPCGPEWRAWSDPHLDHAMKQVCADLDPEGDGVARVGVHALYVPSPATLVVDDEHFEQAYVAVQVDASHGRVLRYAGCGGVHVPTEGHVTRIFVYATHVEEDTGAVCLASSGTVTVLPQA